MKAAQSDRLARPVQFLRTEGLFGIAIVIGAALRLYAIGDQILADDEWHALRAALTYDWGYIASHFGGADYSIPLALLYKALLGSVGLSEMLMRAPVLVGGIAGLIGLAWLVRISAGKQTGDIFAFLLAVSPFHVYFSRYARPYAISMALSFAALLAITLWWNTGKRRWAVLFVLAAVLAPYFHMTSLPVVVAPLPLLLAMSLLGRREGRSRGVLGLAGAVVLGLVLLLAAPLAHDSAALLTKTGADRHISSHTVSVAFQLWTGTAHGWLQMLMLAPVIAGALLLRRQQLLLIIIALVLVVQAAALAITKPYLAHHGITLARYGLIVVPISTLLMGQSLAQVEHALGRILGWFPSGASGLAAAALLFALGPLPSTYRLPNNWTNHALYQYVYDLGDRLLYAMQNLGPPVTPRFYEELSHRPPASVYILEAPWYYDWHHAHYPLLQYRHRQRMSIGFVSPLQQPSDNELPLADSRLRFGHFTHVSDIAMLRRRDVDYVIFHRDLRSELATGSSMPAIDVTDWIDFYTQRVGAPVYDAEGIVVFDLAPERRRY
ncbi:MAG: hypothetical protein AB1486_34280 [Planctomycetota bacterium]